VAIIALEDIRVRFGGLVALNGVSCEVSERAFVGLIGPNGAGKTTLLGVASGLVTPSSGAVLLAGHDVTRLPPHRRAKLGLSRTFQRSELWGSMTVRENLRTAAEFAKGWNPDIKPVETADDLVEMLDLTQVAGLLPSALPTGTVRLVEVGRALASRPRLMLLDEPSAGLDEGEIHALGEILSSFSAQGTAILMVEHHVEMVLQYCSDVLVLDFGNAIYHGPAAGVRNDLMVRSAYLGTRYADNS
jgi:branched-chain amino acid transport system ATP-binding protein